MNLAQKIGQLLVVGFDGTEINEHIETLITKYHVGNIILFERNCKTPEQIFNLIQSLQRLAMESNGLPLFITIDQENGTVTRIYDGITVFPGNMAQAAGATINEVRTIARYTGIGLKALGVNFNLAPSVDVNNNPLNPVIGTRSFGENAEKVAELTNACIDGIQEAGVIATAKHFPGHGDTNTDSHLALPEITYDKERLDKVELLPFKEAIKHGVKAIMSAHIKFPAYEMEHLPSTLSYKIITKLLREELGFKGLVITDCMEMKAIDTSFGTCKATPMAILAGVDLVCLSHQMQKQIGAIEEIYRTLDSGELTEERIDESVTRIIQEKQNYDIQAFLNTNYYEAKEYLYQEEHKVLAEKISNQSITLLKNNGLVPIQAKDILIVAPSGRVLTGADGTRVEPNFATYFKQKVCSRNVEAVEIDTVPTDEQIEDVVIKAKHKEVVILCTHNGILVTKQIELVKKVIKVNENVILIPMRNPYDIEMLTEVECCILPYEYTRLSMDSLVKVLMGDIKAKGVLPITLNI